MRTVIFLLCLFISTVMMADPVTQTEAQKKAQAFLWQRNPISAHRAMRRAQALSESSDEQAPLYIFNVGDDNGFVIVSGEDRTVDILGYSDTGHIDTDDMPEGLRDLLNQYTDIIKRISLDTNFKTSTEQSLHRISGKAPIAPLLECKWNQSAPFNTQCPVLPDGNNCAVGCTAVAMAQVMYYHKWPAQTTREIGAYTSETNSFDIESVPAGTMIDWDNILPTYQKNTYNGTPSEDAVANLMKLCGRSVRMNYDTSSGAYLSSVMYALDAIFDYEAKTMKYVFRSNYSYDEWQELLYKELEENRPILFQGQKSVSSHAFVCDGYDSDDLFHINWGWGGTSDGYYRLNVLKAGEEGIGGSLSSDGYKMNTGAIIGIQKNDGIDDHISPTLYAQDVTLRDKETLTYQRKEDGSFDPIYILYCVINYSAVDNYDVAVLITDMQDNIIKIIEDPLVQNYNFMQPSFWASHCWEDGENTIDLSVPVTIGNDLSDGDFKFVVGCRLAGTPEYLPCVDSDKNYLHFNISGNTLSIDPVPIIRLVGEPVIEGDPTNRSPFTITLQVRNDGAPLIDDLQCYVDPVFNIDHSVVEKYDYRGAEHVELGNGESKTIKFSYTPKKGGLTKLLFTWERNEEVLAEISVDVKPAGVVSFSNGTVENYNEELNAVVGSPFTMSLTAENIGDGDYHQTATVYLLVYNESKQIWYMCDDKNGTKHVSEEWEINLAQGEKETKTFSFDVGSLNCSHCLYVVYNQGNESNDFWGTSYMVCSPIEFSIVDIPGAVYNEEQNLYNLSSSTISYQIQATNHASVPYNEPLSVSLIYYKEETGRWTFVNKNLTPNIEWNIENLQPGESQTKTFSWENLDFGKIYSLYFTYTLYGDIRSFLGDYVSTVDPTGILNIESSPSNSLRGGEPCGEPEVWYNLSGQRVSKGYKGIVVVKGKKYVIN